MCYFFTICIFVCSFISHRVMAAEFINSVRSGELLVVHNYLFRIDRNIAPVRRWKCRTNGCSAMAKTEGRNLVRAAKIEEHDHVNDDAECRLDRDRQTNAVVVKIQTCDIFTVARVLTYKRHLPLTVINRQYV